MEKSRKTTTKSDPSTGDQLSKRRAEMSGPVVSPKPCRRWRSEARPGAGNCPARPGRTARCGPVRPGPAEGERRERLTRTVEITCGCRRMTDRARHFANFWKQIDKNDKVLSVYGGSVLRIEKNGKVRRAGRSSRAFVAHGQ